MYAIGINAHLLSGQAGYRRAGIHHYMVQVLRHLPALTGYHYTIFTRSQNEIQSDAQRQIVSSRWPTERRLARIVWEQTAWPLAAWQRRLDLLHGMAFATPLLSPCPTVVTIYDLSFVHYPDRFPLAQRYYLLAQTRRACRQARRVVAISAAGRQDIHQVLGVALAQIDVVLPGVDHAFQPLPPEQVAAFRRAKQLPDRFILHVGTLQPRKNLPTLIAAFADLIRRSPRYANLQLVLVGGKGWLYNEIFALVEKLELQQQVRFAGYVPDVELPLWYNASALLIFPSVYEGFGLPILEAMACGTPVIAAETAVVPEVIGEAGLLFPATEAAALVDALSRVLDQPELAAAMRHAGLIQAQNFTWEQAGRQMVAVYQQALAAK
ncbi:MAG: glycosyltransferase family 1 protein [Candidatus Promineifilaceae bacterium]